MDASARRRADAVAAAAEKTLADALVDLRQDEVDVSDARSSWQAPRPPTDEQVRELRHFNEVFVQVAGGHTRWENEHKATIEGRVYEAFREILEVDGKVLLLRSDETEHRAAKQWQWRDYHDFLSHGQEFVLDYIERQDVRAASENTSFARRLLAVAGVRTSDPREGFIDELPEVTLNGVRVEHLVLAHNARVLAENNRKVRVQAASVVRSVFALVPRSQQMATSKGKTKSAPSLSGPGFLTYGNGPNEVRLDLGASILLLRLHPDRADLALDELECQFYSKPVQRRFRRTVPGEPGSLNYFLRDKEAVATLERLWPDLVRQADHARAARERTNFARMGMAELMSPELRPLPVSTERPVGRTSRSIESPTL